MLDSNIPREINLDPTNAFSATIDLQVNPTSPVKVVFPAASGGVLPTPPESDTSSQHEGEPARLPGPHMNLESHNLSYLPSLHLRINLPDGYPEEKPPRFELSTNPSWLSRAHLDELEGKGELMWEEAGRAQVAFGYIDYLQQSAENAFGFAGEGKILEIPQDHKISLLDSDIRATQAAFAKETFDCGVCLGKLNSSVVCHLLTLSRTKERPRMPSNDRLRTRLLRPMPSRLLQQCHQGRRFDLRPLYGSGLCEEAG